MIKGSMVGLEADVVNELNKLDALLKTEIIITSGYRQGDSGEHGKGLAVDIVVPAYAGRLLDLYLSSERLGWKGIGVYPTWKAAGKTTGGLHLDMRKGAPARWMGLGSGKSQQYVALNAENLKKEGVI